MGERNSNLPTTRLALSAAAIACLAGTASSLAQAQPGGARQPAPSASSRPAFRQAGAPPAEKPQPEAKVKVDDHLIVDLHVNDEDLLNVLQMLSIQSQKNIVTSKNVAANITANLYGVSLWEALDAILHVNGYGYIERGNFIYVYTLDEIKTLLEAQRVMVWKVLKLNYLNSTDAAEFVKPLLSEKGQIKTNGKAPAFTLSDAVPGGSEEFAHDSTLLVFDFEENLTEIEKVLQQMDTRPQQVLVEATILQTALNEANAFGVDFSIIGDLSFGDFVNIGGPLKAADGLINGNGSGTSNNNGGSGGGNNNGGSSGGTPLPSDGRGGAVVSTAGNTSGPATFKAGIVYNDVAAFIRLLDQVSDTTIISRPNLLALNRVPARVLVGRKVGYLNTTSTDTATTQTVEFLETGTQLYFRPFISSDGSIRMELKPKVSEAVIRNVTNSGGAAVTIPDEISNELTTNVIIRDGQTIVLGGLFRESTQANRSQVPGAGDLPVIGALFRGHDDTTQRNEVMFLITPTIVSDTVLLEQGKRGLTMVEQVRAGSREGLLPWSREKRTQQMLVQATDLAEQGRRDEALYRVQRALRLSHNQPDAIALREKLMGRRDIWPARSIQDEVIHGEMQKRLDHLPPEAPRGAAARAKAPAPRKAAASRNAPAAPAPGNDALAAMQPAGPSADTTNNPANSAAGFNTANPANPANPSPAAVAPVMTTTTTTTVTTVTPGPTSGNSTEPGAGFGAKNGSAMATSGGTTSRPAPFGPPAPSDPGFNGSPTNKNTSAPDFSSTANPSDTATADTFAGAGLSGDGGFAGFGNSGTNPGTAASASANPAGSTGNESSPGNVEVVRSFQNVWDLLRLYASRRGTFPGTGGTLSTVPTEGATPASDGK
jgi:type IV pilus assembly protein PilQ